MVVPVLIFSLFLSGGVILGTIGGKIVSQVYGILYAGWMYVSFRLIFEATKKNLNLRFGVGLTLMALAPFLSVLALRMINDFIYPLWIMDPL